MMNSLHLDHARALAAERSREVAHAVEARNRRMEQRAERSDALAPHPLVTLLRSVRARFAAAPIVAGATEIALPALGGPEEA